MPFKNPEDRRAYQRAYDKRPEVRARRQLPPEARVRARPRRLIDEMSPSNAAAYHGDIDGDFDL